ncbi:MAG: branched-subunit amino acid transport protein AzlD [Polaribacter sp.]|jgi:branched-subunit amino acid transport protein AzlD
MDWYIPITILPAVGLLILSTTTQMMGLSTEIGGILSERCTHFEHKISALKIKQLSRLTRATALLYVSAACFVLAGILGAILPEVMGVNEKLPQYVLLLGVVLLLFALGLLINYGFNTIGIRKMQHGFNPHMHEEEHD